MGLSTGVLEAASSAPTFENQQQLAKDQANVVNNCWSEGSYELGVEALSAFRKGERRYPSPSHIRHLLALALYPPENTTQPPVKSKSPSTPPKPVVTGSRPLAVSAPLSPRKLAQTEIPTPHASQLALQLLASLAATTHPAHLTEGLSSYTRQARDASDFDSILSTGKIDTFKSPLAAESVQVGRARDCWTMVRNGFLLPKDGGSSTTQAKWMDSDEAEFTEEVDDQTSSYVASHAWGVVGWWVKLFEVDQAICSAELGSASPSKLLLSHIPSAPRPGVPQNDVQTAVGVALSALRDTSTTSETFQSGCRLLVLLINASATHAISPGTLIRAAADQLQTFTCSAFKNVFTHLSGPVGLSPNPAMDFPAHLYYRFCFCLASCHLAKTGAGVSDIGVFGGTTNLFSGPKPRPTARPAGTSESQTVDVARSQALEPYPSPSLEATRALLRSTPSSEGIKSESLARVLSMHALARQAIVASFEKQNECQSSGSWIPDNDFPGWKAGIAESIRLGFEADVRAGAESLEGCALWKAARAMCEVLCDGWL